MAAAAKGDGGMNVAGLAALWEEIAVVRNFSREHGLLMKVPPGASFCDCNRANAVANTAVLIPCLERMRENDLKLPYIGLLQEEVDRFFKQTHLKISEKIAYRTAGEIKKILSFFKRKAQKKEVTKEIGSAWSKRSCIFTQSASDVYRTLYLCTNMLHDNQTCNTYTYVCVTRIKR